MTTTIDSNYLSELQQDVEFHKNNIANAQAEIKRLQEVIDQLNYYLATDVGYLRLSERKLNEYISGGDL